MKVVTIDKAIKMLAKELKKESHDSLIEHYIALLIQFKELESNCTPEQSLAYFLNSVNMCKDYVVVKDSKAANILYNEKE